MIAERGNQTNKSKNPIPLQIIYDGECPFCASYIKFSRLKDQFETLELINARDKQHPLVNDIIKDGYDLNEGMIAVYGEDTFYGADAMHRLALLTTRSGFFNRFVSLTMSNNALAKALYPFLKAGRKAALFILGRKQI